MGLGQPAERSSAKAAGDGPPAAKRARRQVTEAAGEAARIPEPDDLQEGTPVIYWGEYHGLIHDAFVPLDEFWVTESKSGKIVRGENGEIVQFKAAELQLLKEAPEVAPAVFQQDKVGVLLVGREDHMVKILEHFGAPSTDQRCNPQQLLAIPCGMCDGDQLSAAAADGVPEDVLGLARQLRPDIHVGVRSIQMKQAAERVGPELLLMEGYYCVSAVQLPFGQDTIDAEGLSEAERISRRDLHNQVDLCITAAAEQSGQEAIEAVARRALGEMCGVEVSDTIWQPEVQVALRRRMGVADLATGFVDAGGMQVLVMVLPEDATASKIRGLLCFSEPSGVDYLSTAASAPTAAPRKLSAAASAAGDAGDQPEQLIQGKTVREWAAAQAEFAGEPALPSGWLRIRSRTTGQVYYYNKRTLESTFEFPRAPLPPGWTKQVSKSTGKTYYFHAERKVSTFDRPTE